MNCPRCHTELKWVIDEFNQEFFVCSCGFVVSDLNELIAEYEAQFVKVAV
jgi:hypothetical protein